MNTDKKSIFNRLFLGIELPESVKAEILQFQHAHQYLDGIHWVAPQNLHITVIFLGKVSEEIIQNLLEMIRVVTKDAEPFELVNQGYVIGPNAKRARMIWVRWQRNPQYTYLSQRIGTLYKQIQPNLQHRNNPIPHTTVARFRGFRRFENLRLDFPSSIHRFEIKRIVLWNSIATSKGSLYEPVETFSL